MRWWPLPRPSTQSMQKGWWRSGSCRWRWWWTRCCWTLTPRWWWTRPLGWCLRPSMLKTKMNSRWKSRWCARWGTPSRRRWLSSPSSLSPPLYINCDQDNSNNCDQDNFDNCDQDNLKVSSYYSSPLSQWVLDWPGQAVVCCRSHFLAVFYLFSPRPRRATKL